MAATRDWDALVEDIRWMIETGETPEGVMARLRMSGQFSGQVESLIRSMRRKGVGDDVIQWLNDKELRVDAIQSNGFSTKRLAKKNHKTMYGQYEKVFTGRKVA